MEEKDIRTPLTLKLPSQINIIDYKITQQNDAQISDFKLTKLNSNTLSIDWKYFDPNHGFKFQIIFSGKLGTLVNHEFLKGKILDIEKFNKFSNYKEEDINIKFITIFPVLLLIMLGIYDLSIRKSSGIRYRILGGIEILLGIISLGYFIWEQFFKYQTPPF